MNPIPAHFHEVVAEAERAALFLFNKMADSADDYENPSTSELAQFALVEFVFERHSLLLEVNEYAHLAKSPRRDELLAAGISVDALELAADTCTEGYAWAEQYELDVDWTEVELARRWLECRPASWHHLDLINALVIGPDYMVRGLA